MDKLRKFQILVVPDKLLKSNTLFCVNYWFTSTKRINIIHIHSRVCSQFVTFSIWKPVFVLKPTAANVKWPVE